MSEVSLLGLQKNILGARDFYVDFYVFSVEEIIKFLIVEWRWRKLNRKVDDPPISK